MSTSLQAKLEQLESQLAQLNEQEPRTAPERKKIESNQKNLTQRVANLKSYLVLEVGTLVTDGQKVGTVSVKQLSPGGMPEVWVTWSGAKGLLPEQPARLTVVTPPPWAVVPKPQLADDAPTVASLFTGGGLFEAGALAAGFRPIWGIEFDPNNPDFSRQIADAYEHNFGSHLIRQTVQEVATGGFKHLERPTVLHISQPCKSFSAANSGTETPKDITEARAVGQALRELEPPLVTVENVVSYSESESWRLIRQTLTELNYGIQEEVVNAADYGVPQTRKRFLAIAVQNQSTEDNSNFRIPTSPLGGGKGGVDFRLPPMGWWEASADLIPTLPESQLADWQKERIQNLKAKIPNGKAYLIERTGARKDRDLLVRAGSEPMWTVKASIATDHKGSNRKDPLNLMLADGSVMSLNSRALARLQSVPDWYELPEPIGVAVTLIGNGVPCLLAQRLMEALKPCLENQSLEQSQIQNRSTERGSTARLSARRSLSARRMSHAEVQNPYVWLALDEIRRDGGTQPRVKMDMAHIKRLEEQMEEGQQLEPVVVFHDGESYWLADGFHRWQAHSNQSQGAGSAKPSAFGIACTIETGSRRDAILYSVGANADHKPALPRSRQDKRRAVMTLLNDPEWKNWSNYKIAEVCRVNEKTVRNIRKTVTTEIRSDGENLTTDLTTNSCSDNSTRTYTTKHGTVSTMNTANIGSQKAVPLTVNSDSEEVSQSSPVPPQKVEVSTNDILIAFVSNLDCMSEAQVSAAVRAIANRDRTSLYRQLFAPHDQERLDEVVTALLEYWERDKILDLLKDLSE